MKLSTTIERIEQALDDEDHLAIVTRKYLARLAGAVARDKLGDLDIKARMSKAAKKAVEDSPKAPKESGSEGAEQTNENAGVPAQ